MALSLENKHRDIKVSVFQKSKPARAPIRFNLFQRLGCLVLESMWFNFLLK